MALSYELISQFAKLAKEDKKTTTETTVYGMVKVDANGNKYVKLDGSDQLTPLTDKEQPAVESTSVNANDGERVSVLIKDHTATVTGNISSPSARTGDVEKIESDVSEIKKFDILIGDRVQANEGYIKTLQTDKANVGDLTAANAKITELETSKASVEELNAAKAEITDLAVKKLDADVANATYATIEKLDAANADIYLLHVNKLSVEDANLKYATIQNLDAANANIAHLEASKLSAEAAELTYATIVKLNAINADVDNLEVSKLSAEDAKLIYANIDFSNIGEAAVEKLFSDSGIIGELVMSDGKVTGELVGVTIKGDLIEGNTIVAEKLVVKGDDGLYYALNYEGGAITGDKVADALYYEVRYDEESGEYIASDIPIDALSGSLVDGALTTDGREVYSLVNESGETVYYCVDSDWANENLHGSILVAKSVTANKVQVDDLVAFDATIGGFQINDHNIHSGVKASVDNVAKGVYLDDEGQFSVGDGDNHIKYYKDIDGAYKLDIAAESILAQIKEATLALKNTSNNIEKHFSFTDDGLIISAGENQMSIRIDHDAVMFEKNGVMFGWWDGINFHTGNIMVEVNDRAQFGNFAFIPRSDGSLSFLKVEHNTGFYIRLAGSTLVIYGAYPTLEDSTLLITDISGELEETTLILGGE